MVYKYHNIFQWYIQAKYDIIYSIKLYRGRLTMNNALICERLIECRNKLGITKQEAAKRMQMSQPAYLRYESGERTPSIHVIYFMANVLGTSVDYLTGKTDNPNPTCYWIDSSTDPELFSLVETYSNSDNGIKERLITYGLKIMH